MEQHMILMARKPTHPGEVLREEFMPCLLYTSDAADE